MSGPHRSDPIEAHPEAALHSLGPTPIETHLQTTLEAMDNEVAKYHLCEAYQKCVVLAERGEI